MSSPGAHEYLYQVGIGIDLHTEYRPMLAAG